MNAQHAPRTNKHSVDPSQGLGSRLQLRSSTYTQGTRPLSPPDACTCGGGVRSSRPRGVAQQVHLEQQPRTPGATCKSVSVQSVYLCGVAGLLFAIVVVSMLWPFFTAVTQLHARDGLSLGTLTRHVSHGMDAEDGDAAAVRVRAQTRAPVTRLLLHSHDNASTHMHVHIHAPRPLVRVVAIATPAPSAPRSSQTVKVSAKTT